MRILVDENMPYARQLFSDFGEVITVAGRSLSSEQLRDVDALMVRSVTNVDEALLAEANKLKFVGSATIGTDHVDLDYLHQRDITFCNAPGCNSVAVAEYVLSSIFALAENHRFSVLEKTVGIVGYGNIGAALAKRLKALGINFLICDPPKASKDPMLDFASMSQIAQADIITFHVPLTKEGEYPTWHMADESFLRSLQDGTILINSARGAVVDNQALANVLRDGKRLHTVLDVWENEPDIDRDLLNRVEIATPHIAGHSVEGKANGTQMLYQAFAQTVGLRTCQDIRDYLPSPAIKAFALGQTPDHHLVGRLLRNIYDVQSDDARFRTQVDQPGGFDQMRRQYGPRRECSSAGVIASPSVREDQLAPLHALGFRHEI